MFPGDRFLMDTMRSLVLKEFEPSIDTPTEFLGYTIINVVFDEDGYIKEINPNSASSATDSLNTDVLERTKVALQNFPRLMEVDHPYYQPQIIPVLLYAEEIGHRKKF